jgi:hypothetical protein
MPRRRIVQGSLDDVLRRSEEERRHDLTWKRWEDHLGLQGLKRSKFHVGRQLMPIPAALEADAASFLRIVPRKRLRPVWVLEAPDDIDLLVERSDFEEALNLPPIDQYSFNVKGQQRDRQAQLEARWREIVPIWRQHGYETTAFHVELVSGTIPIVYSVNCDILHDGSLIAGLVSSKQEFVQAVAATLRAPH